MPNTSRNPLKLELEQWRKMVVIVVEFVIDFEVNLDGVAEMMDVHEVVEVEVVSAVERGWLANYSALVGSDWFA